MKQFHERGQGARHGPRTNSSRRQSRCCKNQLAEIRASPIVAVSPASIDTVDPVPMSGLRALVRFNRGPPATILLYAAYVGAMAFLWAHDDKAARLWAVALATVIARALLDGAEEMFGAAGTSLFAFSYAFLGLASPLVLLAAAMAYAKDPIPPWLAPLGLMACAATATAWQLGSTLVAGLLFFPIALVSSFGGAIRIWRADSRVSPASLSPILSALYVAFGLFTLLRAGWRGELITLHPYPLYFVGKVLLMVFVILQGVAVMTRRQMRKEAQERELQRLRAIETAENLRESREKLDVLTQSSQSFVFQVAPDGVANLVSAPVGDAPGADGSDVSGEGGLVHPEDYPRLRDQILDTRNEGAQGRGLYRARIHENESYLWWDITSTPMRTGVRDVYVLVVARSVTALKEAEERYRRLAEHAPFGTLAVDARLEITDANRAFAAMVDETSGDALVGRRLTDPVLALPGAVVGSVTTCLEGGDTPVVETGWERKGEERRLRAYFAPLEGAAPDVTGCLILAEDVTQEHELQQRLQQAHQARSRGPALGGVATTSTTT